VTRGSWKLGMKRKENRDWVGKKSLTDESGYNMHWELGIEV
jgi:hypothetical protein